MSLTLHTYMPNYRAYKVLIAAEYNELKVEVPAMDFPKDAKSKEFLKKNPLGKVPVLDTESGPIFESNAIARYVARMRPDKGLYGANFYESGLVDQWIDFSVNEIEASRAIWLFPVLGYMPFDQQAYDEAKKDLQKSLAILNGHLADNTYLVGHQITLADIVVVTALLDLFTKVMDSKFRKPYTNVLRWFNTCINQAEFAQVIGKVKLCSAEAKAAAAGNAAAKNDNNKKNNNKKNNNNKKGGDNKKGGNKKARGGRKPKNPLDLLPKSKMSMDGTKKAYYAAKKAGTTAAFWKEFWANNYDDQGYCCYFSEYGYNEDNRVFFMTCNLVGGFLQRLDPLRKYAMGVQNVFGKDESSPPFKVSGAWLFRGLDIPAEMKDCPDAEWHNFTKCDTNNAADRKKFQDAFDSDAGVLEKRQYK